MKIDVLCNDGSPLHIVLDDVHGKNGQIGVGGAEIALMTLCEAWAKRGDEVILYNDPHNPNNVFEQRPIQSFNPGDARDVLIIFRSPNRLSYIAGGRKIWWSTDQYTIGDFREFSSTVQSIVTISKLHSEYFKSTYGIENTIPIDLPVRTWEYDQDIERIPNQLIFCSIPDRGLNEMAIAWERLYREVPDISLIITSDYRLWGAGSPLNESYLFKFVQKGNARFLGAIKRDELVRYQLQSDIMSYPCTYQELFCISAAECQVAGAYPVTSDFGALATTNMGTIIKGNPSDTNWLNEFTDRIIYLLNHRDELELRRWKVQEQSRKRFSINNILNQWDTKVFEK